MEKPRGQWVNDVVAWCHQHDIDLASRINSKALRFDGALLAQINDVLDSARIAPLARSLSGLPSSAQAKEGVEEDKANRESPRARRVLVSFPSQPIAGLAIEPRAIRDVDVQTLKLSAFSALIQVENLDSFYAFSPEQPALSGYVNPLVVYRGDSHYGGGFALLAEAWHKTQRPHIYAGDFDVKGVTLAPPTCSYPPSNGSPQMPRRCTCLLSSFLISGGFVSTLPRCLPLILCVIT
ncbi:DUF7281 domain-containing protein [Vreelandella populi]|uniref:DUF7281 domain-containing protein n=1 Tax=Vreelandella populi TaxID=2498858 RepID=UPI0021AEFB6A|nr:hypothetical protein [Halomonas populi]